MPKSKQPFFVKRPFITFNYRAGNLSFNQCTESLYAYLHNESANVFTHLLPSIYFTAQLVMVVGGFGYFAQFKSWESVALQALAGFGMAYDMWTSTIYHLYNAMGERQCETLLKWDMTGTIAIMSSSFIALFFNLFAEWSEERTLIMAVIIPLLVVNLVMLFVPACAGESMFCHKVIVIALTQICLFVAFGLGYLWTDNTFFTEEIYPRILIALLTGIGAFFFFESHVPERIPCLAQYHFMQLYLNSHVLWHILIFVGEF